MSDYIDELVREHGWDGNVCLPIESAVDLAAAVREAVLKEKAAEIDRLIELLLHIATCGNGLNRECDRCGTLNSDLIRAAISLRGRGVVEGET